MQYRRRLREHTNLVTFSARTLDVVGIMLAGYLAQWLRFSEQFPNPSAYDSAILIAGVLAFAIFPMMNVYRAWRGSSLFAVSGNLVWAWTLLAVLLLVLATATKTGALFSRWWMVYWYAIGLVVLVGLRVGYVYLVRAMRANGWSQRRVLIVGAGSLGRQVAQRVQQAPWTGFDLRCFADDNPQMAGKTYRKVRVCGSLDDVPALIEQQQIDEVWLALPFKAHERMTELLDSLKHETVAIKLIPDIYSFRLLNHTVSDVAGIPVMNLTESPMQGLNQIVKAGEDRILALLILVLVSPLMLALAVGVKLSSPGPAFYRQERVSWNGKPFMMLKFRSMPIDAEAQTGAVWAKSGENRATRIGRFLRRTSLDELPQFINVLKGDMSIVGPRPERPVFVQQFKNEIPDYMQKHLVKAGITGWAQINGWRGDTDLNKRIEFDLYYIEHWSLWFDLKIIALTLFRGFFHKHAY